MKEAALRRKRFAGLAVGAALVVLLLGAAPAIALYKATHDSYVASANPTSNYGNGQLLRAGHNGFNKNLRTYLRFPNHTLYNPGCQVSYSQVSFAADDLPWGDNFWFAPAAGTWVENTITWNFQPNPVVSAESHADWVHGAGIIHADVTEPVQYLDNNAVPERGLVLRSKTTGAAVDVVAPHSSEAGYQNHPGIVTAWDC